MPPKPVIYFAHSMQDYDTRIARDALGLIKKLCPGIRVMDPEKLRWGELEERHGRLGVYRHVVGRCSRVVVLEHAGALARGAALECELALASGKPVHVLRNRQILPVCKVLQKIDGNFEDFARVRVGAPLVIPAGPRTCFPDPTEGGWGC